jgi:hypothetical protein
MKRKLAFLGAILLAAFIFTYEGNTYQTHALDEEDQAWIEEARGALQNIVEDREVMALVYLCDDLTIRAEAAEDSTKVVTVPSGQMVEILDVTVAEDYQVWEKVSAEVSGKVYEGYIPRKYLACSDERFLEWEELYSMNPGEAVMLAEENAAGHRTVPGELPPGTGGSETKASELDVCTAEYRTGFPDGDQQ